MSSGYKFGMHIALRSNLWVGEIFPLYWHVQTISSYTSEFVWLEFSEIWFCQFHLEFLSRELSSLSNFEMDYRENTVFISLSLCVPRVVARHGSVNIFSWQWIYMQPMFCRNMSPPFSGLKNKPAYFNWFLAWLIVVHSILSVSMSY
jgi:hypothetical protein